MFFAMSVKRNLYQQHYKLFILFCIFASIISYFLLDITVIQYVLLQSQETDIHVITATNGNISLLVQPEIYLNYTSCEDRNLGYTWLKNEFLFEKIIICGPPLNMPESTWKSKGYSLIECYRSNNETQIKIQFCREYNIYGYLTLYPNTNNYYINYQHRCIPNPIHWNNRYQYGWNALWGIYSAFNKRNKPTIQSPMQNISYIDNKIWFVENGLQCVANLWHCSAQMIIMNAIQTFFGE
eukprot:191053_1